MAITALIKAVSLGYVLGAVALSIAACGWWVAQRLVAPHLRARIGFWVLSGTFALNTLFTILLYVGVTTGQIRMTTSLFHHLMAGGWGALITGSGAVLLLASLLISAYQIQRSLIHGRSETAPVPGAGTFYGVALRYSAEVATVAIVGSWKPQIWINPGYWAGLDATNRQLALHHELVHLRNHDNLKQLVLGGIASLYAILPWLKRWPEHYRFLTELAADAACLKSADPGVYRRLIMHAAGAPLPRHAPVASNLSTSQLAARLACMDRKPAPHAWLPALATLVLITAAGSLPAVAMAASAETRCLVACYLGY
jgi:hypothetical protein